MKWRLGSFRNKEQTSAVAFVLLSGGMLHIGQGSLRGRVSWREPVLIADVETHPLEQEIRRLIGRRTKTVLIGLEGAYVRIQPEMLSWTRERANTPVSIAEMRAISRELTIRGRESLRRHHARAQQEEYIETMVERVEVDGRRVFNPTGFSGTMIRVQAQHCYAAKDIAGMIERIRSAASRTRVRTIPLDGASQRVLIARGASFPAVILGEASTTLFLDTSASRHVIGIGEESIAQYLARSDFEEDAEDIATFLYAHQESSRRHRELMALTLPAIRRWARSVEHVLAEGLLGREDASVTMLFPWRVSAPFRHAVHPQIRAQVFRSLPRVRWQLLTIPELLQQPVKTRHDAYAALLREIDAKDARTTYWT